MTNAVYVPKTGFALNVEFFTQLSDVSLEVLETDNALICTPIPGKLFKLLFLLKEWRVPYEMIPTNIAS
jgi:hypothetical protein